MIAQRRGSHGRSAGMLLYFATFSRVHTDWMFFARGIECEAMSVDLGASLARCVDRHRACSRFSLSLFANEVVPSGDGRTDAFA